MTRRYPNPGLVKINRSYEVHELALLFGTHRNTIRGWITKGLKTTDGSRPYLLHGTDVREFLQAQRKSAYSKCQPHELFCLKCKAPKEPLDKRVAYMPFTESSGNFQGICPDCGKRIFRRVSFARLGTFSGKLVIQLPQATLDIGDIPKPCVNCDLGDPGDTHDKVQP
ncbi:helix-turn-helix domain-containing protein [Aestuariivirga litoralis]|uniref:helix-turn-helix domain-containing protein n=1 Tax=Aestuariivirga litoralis TaxID=2650924 RepID=UPI0018C54580|nr:helix-turn-helix domain-containing protein [Aestuariivirga litoralis]MBG1231810.1 helix-turn-helix domain-containing protein [Aestuariivirga litoralis]